jgi:sterol desaturase/sphingolipid hydroxylase (fatty acid hydroxylase superfamily)
MFMVAMCAILTATVPSALSVPEDLWAWNGFTNFMLRFLLMAIIDDAIFYAAHRSFHRNLYLWKTVHKMHHEFNHPIAPATLYTHWLDFICSYATEFWVGPLLVCHGVLDIYALCFYNFTGMIGAACIHAGVPLKLPFVGIDIVAHHDSHHQKGHSSYGVWGFADFLMGTLPAIY